MLLTPDCHVPDMAMPCTPGVIAWHPQRFAEPCRLNILKLVSSYYHLHPQSFHSPHCCCTQITRAAVVPGGAPAAVGSAGPPPSALCPGQGPGGGSGPPDHQARRPPPKKRPPTAGWAAARFPWRSGSVPWRRSGRRARLGFGQPGANHGVGQILGGAAIKATDPGQQHPLALAQGPQIDAAMAR